MAYYLGIDGGGSKTACAVADESSLLATIIAGPSNITRVGEACAREALQKAIREACAAAKIAPRELHRACIGVAGAGRPEIADTIRKITSEIIVCELDVVGDMEIAMAAAFDAGPGLIVIAGTGSIAYGRNAQGKTARAGGWGFAISDEGSAHWIGRTTTTALLRAIDQSIGRESLGLGNDGQAASDQFAAGALPLFDKLKAAWDLHTLDEFARIANSNPDFAILFPAILAAAEGGDALAQRVLKQAGRELAEIAGMVVRRLFPEDNSVTDIPVATVGGVFHHSPLVRNIFREQVLKLDSRLQVNSQVIDPVAGAIMMARHGHGKD